MRTINQCCDYVMSVVADAIADAVPSLGTTETAVAAGAVTSLGTTETADAIAGAVPSLGTTETAAATGG